MANNDATIIATRLTSTELETSINELVSKVDKAMGSMAKSVDNAIGGMKSSFSQLAKDTRDSASAARELAREYDTVAASIAKATGKGIGSFGGFGTKQVVTSEKQALQEFNKAYHDSVDKVKAEQERLNKIAEMGRLSAQQSMRPRERWDVRQDSEINRLRMALHGYESDLKRLERLNISMQDQAWNKINEKINSARMQIAKYKEEQERLRRMPAEDGFQRNAIVQKFEILNQKIKEAEANIRRYEVERRKVFDTNFTAAGQDAARRNIEQTKEAIHQMGVEMEKFYTSEKRAAQVASELYSQYAKKRGVSSASYVDSEGRSHTIQFQTEEQIKRQILQIEKQIAAERQKQVTTNSTILTQSSNQLEIARRQKEEQDRWFKLFEQSNRKAGVQAQQQAAQLRQSFYEQAGTLKDDQLMSGVRRMAEAIQKMRYLYYSLDQSGRETPFGQALKRDIELSEKALAVAIRYNKTVNGMTNFKTGEQTQEKQKLLYYERLNEIVKQLKEQFKMLSMAEMQSAKGQALADKIQSITRQMQKMQEIMSRPVSFDKVNILPERTISDINYKMRQLSLYKSGLDVNKQADEIKRVNQEYERLNRELQKTMSSNHNLIQSNNALARSFNYMKNRLAFYFTVGASTQFVKTLVDIRTQYEMAEKSIGILINSAERGSEIFSQLSTMALNSPYTLIELANAAKQLSAYDIAAKDVVDTTRRLADITAAVGIPIERLTYALGQIKAYGYLNARDARMFSNAGIPLVNQLAEHYSKLEGRLVSVSDIYDRIKKKTIDFESVMQVITRMTDEGGKFFDYQAKMAGTLKVQLANLTLAWNNMLNDIGKSNSSLITAPIKGLKELFLQWKNISRIITSLAFGFGIVKLAQFKVLTAVNGMNTSMATQAVLGKKLSGVWKGLGRAWTSLTTSPMTWWTLAITAIIDMAHVIDNAIEKTKEFNKALSSLGADRYDEINRFVSDSSISNIRKSLYTWGRDEGGAVIKEGIANIDEKEAQKAWESIREQIETSSGAADLFIGRLEGIEDINDRVRASFDYLDKIQRVAGAMKDIGDNDISIAQDYSAWWNAYYAPEGLVENLHDAQKAIDGVHTTTDTLKGVFLNTIPVVGQMASYFRIFHNDVEQVRKDLQQTTQDLINFSNLKGFDAEEEAEFLSQYTRKFVEQNNLGAKEAFTFRRIQEEEYIKAREAEFKAEINRELEMQKNAANEAERIESEKAANMARTELREWQDKFGKGRVLWEEFTSYMRRNHSAEIRDMFGDMSKEEIEHINWSDPKWRDWAVRNAAKFTSEYGGSFKKLQEYVNDANRMSIFIKLIIGTEEDKSLIDQLEGFDQELRKINADIKRGTEEYNRLYNKRNRTAAETIKLGQIGAEVEAKKGRREALIAQGAKDEAEERKAKAAADKKHRKAVADANKAAAADRRAQAQAESELQKALKNELSLVDKVADSYKKLTAAGETHANALALATSGFSQAEDEINRTLSKYGVSQFKASDYAGVANPREILKLYQQQVAEIRKSGKSKVGEIQDLEVKIKKLEVDAREYDLKQITNGLNREINKIKEEYELAVELDANPELADIFTDMFKLDTTYMTRTIDDVINQFQTKANYAVEKAFSKGSYGDGAGKVGADGVQELSEVVVNFDKKNLFHLMTDDLEAWAQQTGEKVGGDLYKELENTQKELKSLVSKFYREIVNETKDLEYSLGDTAAKIAIKEKELAILERQLAESTNDVERHYLELRIQQQKKAIAQLRSEILRVLPTYKNLYNSVIEHSARVTRRLSKMWKDALENAQVDGEDYIVVDPINGQEVWLSKEERQKEIDKVNKKLRETEGCFVKIREAMAKGEDGIIDWSKGIELIGEEAQKVANIIEESSKIAEALGASEETVEIFNDVAESINGLAEASRGLSQIANGDVLGGAVNVVKGLWKSISGWFDNSNKKIDRRVKESERQITRLEMAYKKLERSIETSMGTAETQARRATIANKKLQLAEMERQLAREKSRKSKNQDEDKMLSLESKIQDLEFEIEDAANEVANTLLGSDIKSAAESFVDAWVSAWKEGSKTLDAMNDKMDEMVYNLIKKSATSAIVGRIIKPLYDAVDQYTSDYSEGGVELTTNEIKALAELGSQLGVKIDTALGAFYNNLEAQNIINKGGASGNLSALQQGIQGITEDTAGALEGYMNIVSQQVFLHSDLLTQIRDSVVSMDGDAQLATQAQMLLQLQQSYSVQMAIQTILEGWSNANGMAVRVELMN